MTTIDDYEGDTSMQWILTALSFLSIAMMMSGCGGGSSSSSTNTPSPFSDEYLEIALATGAYRALATPPDLTNQSVMVFRRLPNGNYLGVTEVSRGQWSALSGGTPWTDVPTSVMPATTNALLPVSNISHVDAQAFASTLASRSGLTARLPSSDDYTSAYGGISKEFPWAGPSTPTTLALYSSVRETTTTLMPVMSKAPIGGIYDLIGSIREWTSSGALVGGGWLDNGATCGQSNPRFSVDAEIRHPLSGMRVSVQP